MKLRFLIALTVTALSMSAISSALADDSKSYTEGQVTNVSSVRTKPGMFDAYMKWLDTTYKQLMEEEKKAGIVVDYAVYGAAPRSPHDPDLYLVVTFKNMGRTCAGGAQRTPRTATGARRHAGFDAGGRLDV
jgi:hypothetical protein